MNRDELTFALSVGNFLLTWGVALYMYLANKNKATNERIAKLEEDILKRMEIQVQRITKLETAAEKSPSHHDLAKVYESLNALAGTVNQLVGENRGQSDTLKLILNQITEKGMR